MTVAQPELIPYLSKVRAYRNTLHPALWEAVQTLLVDFLMVHVELAFPITIGRLETIRAAALVKEITATPDQRQEIADVVLAVWLLNEDRRNGVSIDQRHQAGTRIINWLKRRFGWKTILPLPQVHRLTAPVGSLAANLQEVTSDATA